MRLLRGRPSSSVVPVVAYELATGQDTPFECSEPVCPDSPVAEVVVHYVAGGVQSTIWCVGHLPNLSTLARPDTVQDVELLSTVRNPSRLRRVS